MNLFVYATLAGWTCIVLLASLGPASASIFARHSPAHPQQNEGVRFSARATGEVDKIVLAYQRYELSTNAQGKPVQTPVGSEVTVATCDPPQTIAVLQCAETVPGGFPNSTLIQFKAVVAYQDGTTATETYAFAAGAYPYPDQPIPIRVTGPAASRLDIIFVPAKDLTLAVFRDNLLPLMHDRYFRYEVYGGTAETNYRNMYNFHYSDKFGDYTEGCKFEKPSNYATLAAIGDSITILHKKPLRDCRIGKLFSSEIDYDKSLIHETGHALFDLQDEYCCDSSYKQQACVPNLWSTKAACEADAPNLGYPASYCVQLTSKTQKLNFWRVDPTDSPGCIMGPSQHSDPSSNHGNADLRRILWRFTKCLTGSCYTNPDCP